MLGTVTLATPVDLTLLIGTYVYAYLSADSL